MSLSEVVKMAQLSILALSGSPSPTSKTARVADHILGKVTREGIAVRHIKLRELPAEALLRGDMSVPQIADAVKAIEDARGIVIATPTYKAAYSGLLKVFLDMLPQFGLSGKVVLPCATGGTLAHMLALDYGLRPVLQSMGPRHIIQSLFLPDADVRIEGDELVIEGKTRAILDEAAHHFRAALGSAPAHDLPGHPRPDRLTMVDVHNPILSYGKTG
jgi:FMN reductase